MRDDDLEQTNAPVLRIDRKTVGRRIQLDELNPTDHRLMTFERDIAIFCETEASARVTLNDEPVGSYSTHNDFYGFFTSFADPVQTAKQRATKLGSAVLATATVTITEFGAIAYNKDDFANKFFYKDSVPVRMPPKDWMDVSTPEQLARAETWIAAQNASDLIAAIEARAPFMNGLRREIASLVVYTSELSDDDNLNRFSDTLKQLPVKLTTEQIALRIGKYRDAITGKEL